MSGQPGTCEGPKVYRFHGGACEWTGCPRLSLGAHEDALIRAFDRCEGRLSYTEQLRAPTLLVDAFDLLDELNAQARSYAKQVAERDRG